jgi:hypothetical protein
MKRNPNRSSHFDEAKFAESRHLKAKMSISNPTMRAKTSMSSLASRAKMSMSNLANRAKMSMSNPAIESEDEYVESRD